jgi:RNA polymerase sigma factor (TIGR02999 family)
LLLDWSKGDRSAADKLMPLVYDELRRLAKSYLSRERANHTLQPTALVHEAYMRLIDQSSVSWQNRAQFFGLASHLMRNVLVDHARRRRAAKRGGACYALSISKAERIAGRADVDIVALDEGLKGLAAIKPEHSRIVELKFFGGLTIEEIAEVLGTSHATVERSWSFARAWLRRELSK